MVTRNRQVDRLQQSIGQRPMIAKSQKGADKKACQRTNFLEQAAQ
jgi:hypothetical protein